MQKKKINNLSSINNRFSIKIASLTIITLLTYVNANAFLFQSNFKHELNQKSVDTAYISNSIDKAIHHEKDRSRALKILENTLSSIKKGINENHSKEIQKKLMLQLAVTNSEIGRMLIELSHIKLAVPYLFEALKYYEILKNKQGIAKTSMNIGLAFNDQKNFSKSKAYYDKAKTICLEIKDLKTLAKVYNNYSVSLYDQNKKQESTAYIYKALDVFKKINDKQGISYCLYNIAQKYNDAGYPKEAMPYLMQSLEIRKEINDTRAIAESLNAIGICYRWMNDIPTSLEYLKQANTLAIENGFFHVVESSSNMLNYIYEEDLKDTENALKTYKMYIEARDTIQNEKAKSLLLEKHYEHQYEIEKEGIKKEIEAEKQKQRIIFIIVVSILSLIMILTLAWLYFYKKKKVLEKEIEKKAVALQVAEDERRRISADLHDDLGVSISTIGLLGNRIRKQEKIENVKADANSIIENTKKVSEKLTEVIWELNSEHNNLEDLLLFIQKQGQQIFKETNINFSMVIPLEIPTTFLSSHQRKQLYFVVKEVFHNIIKHANASQVECKVQIKETVSIKIMDNGNGFNVDEKLNQLNGEGLKNMKNRITTISGTINMRSTSEGTQIELTIPFPAK